MSKYFKDALKITFGDGVQAAKSQSKLPDVWQRVWKITWEPLDIVPSQVQLIASVPKPTWDGIVVEGIIFERQDDEWRESRNAAAQWVAIEV